MNNRMPHKPIEELDVFTCFEAVADLVWDHCSRFEYFAKDTVGKQAVRAADSICANLVEGDGRFSEPEAIHYFHVARGSARELRHWIKVCKRRKLMDDPVCDKLIDELYQGARMLNQLIKFRKTALASKRVKETTAPYALESADPFSEAVL